MTIQQLIQELKTTRRNAYGVLKNPKATHEHKRIAMKQIDYCDKQLDIMRKAFPFAS